MSEGGAKTSSAVKVKGEKKEKENYYVRLATNMVTTAKETRLVEDDTQDTFLKGECNTQNSKFEFFLKLFDLLQAVIFIILL